MLALCPADKQLVYFGDTYNCSSGSPVLHVDIEKLLLGAVHRLFSRGYGHKIGSMVNENVNFVTSLSHAALQNAVLTQYHLDLQAF